MICGETLIIFIISDVCLRLHNDFSSLLVEQMMQVGPVTLYCELDLGFYGAVGILRYAGVDAGILLCEIGNLETATSYHLHTTLAENRKENGK